MWFDKFHHVVLEPIGYDHDIFVFYIFSTDDYVA